MCHCDHHKKRFYFLCFQRSQTQVSGYFLGPFGFPKRFPNPAGDKNDVIMYYVILKYIWLVTVYVGLPNLNTEKTLHGWDDAPGWVGGIGGAVFAKDMRIYRSISLSFLISGPYQSFILAYLRLCLCLKNLRL